MKHLAKLLGIFSLIGVLFGVVFSIGSALVRKVKECKDEYEFKKGMDEYLKTHPFK